jgi:zinc/manganese transport system substrate-binding protein
MKQIIIFILLASVLSSVSMCAEITVVTSLPDYADIVTQIGGNRVVVNFIVKGDQNPHFVEVKPSYMMKLKSADIFFVNGMELEMWAPQIVDGSRNSRLQVIDLSQGIEKLEVPEKIDASQGDVHRFGNPHYWLDPRNIRIISGEIVDALSKISPEDEKYFHSNAEAYQKKLDAKIIEWESVLKPFRGSKIITFHRSWTYFTHWLGLDVVDQIEPKPGIQPSPAHTAELLKRIREGNIKAIIVEPFYDTSAPDQIARSSSAKVLQLATSPGGVDEAKDYISMMDYNIRTLAIALQ